MQLSIARRLAMLSLGAALCIAGPAGAYQKSDTAAADNTKSNRGENGKPQGTADTAVKTTADRELTRKIRRAVVQDKSLSTYAKNVKILANHGKVTLKGPVKSDEEKKAVAEHAVTVAGNENVTNEMTVAGEAARK